MIPPPAVPKCRLWAGQVISPSALCLRAPSQEVMLATHPLGSITPNSLGKACAPARSSDRVCSFTSTLACRSDHYQTRPQHGLRLRGGGVVEPACTGPPLAAGLLAHRAHWLPGAPTCHSLLRRAQYPLTQQALTPRSLLSKVTSEHNNFPSRRSLSHPLEGL